MIRKVFPVLALSIFSSMLGVGIISPLLPLYAENLGATGIWLGVIFASFFVTRALFMPLIGKLSDRWGRKPFVSLGLLVYSVISLGYIWAGSVSQLTLVRLIQGTAAGMVIPISLAYIGDISPRGEEGRWMGYFNAAFFTGFGLGPLMGGALSDHFGMHTAFSVMGGLNFLAFLTTSLFLPETERREEGSSSSFRGILQSDLFKGLFSFRLSYALGRGIFTVFLPIFASIYLGLSPTAIGLLIAINILLMSTLQVCSGRMADRLNRKAMVILGGFVSLAYLALIPLAQDFWKLLGLCILGGLGGVISLPAASALVVEEGRKFGMGASMGAFAMAFSIGMAAGPIISGGIVDLTSVQSAFYFAAAAGLLGTVLFAWLSRQQPPII